MNENANIPQIRVSLQCRNKALIYSVMSQMRGLLPLILILALPLAGMAQFGANVRYQFGQSRTLDEVNLSQDGLQAAVEYHFRLKQRRLEFRPALGYRFTWNQAEKEGFLYAFDFDFNTAIYPFDFASDC
ncbi:MAG TPA: hypothetical protein VJ508_17170, partial [Saprospiraceae bacterium]|nr:hypothetical protein [Saprospiraceae bacterium]